MNEPEKFLYVTGKDKAVDDELTRLARNIKSWPTDNPPVGFIPSAQYYGPDHPDRWVWCHGGIREYQWLAKRQELTQKSEQIADDYDMSIHSNPDHNAWAKFFIESWPNGCSDEETMAGWFANAMMAKHDSMASSEMEHTTELCQETLKVVLSKLKDVADDLMVGYHDPNELAIFAHGMHTQVYVVESMIKPEQTERENFALKHGQNFEIDLIEEI